MSGEIVAVNDSLEDEPERVNADVYGEGWLVELRCTDEGELAGLMDAETYERSVSGG